MLELISSSRATQLHNFPNLETKFTYSHNANESEDFQFFSTKNAFVSFNWKSCSFELLRTSTKNNSDIIQRLKKRHIDDLKCGACSDIEKGEIALGLTTGFIRFFDIESAEFLPNRFKPDHANNGVIHLDYSSCGELLAAIYDNGDINLFGLQTKIKMNTFKLDQSSTLVRFHPTKRFQLAVASTAGAITVLDTQTKRTNYQDKTAHKAPCIDLSWSTAKPDTLLTVGYDCTLNVYDVRRKTVVTQTRNDHPYSTVCVSSCGLYCCAGDLKGNLISYDFRNLKMPLATKRAHAREVIRVAFVPDTIKGKRLTLFADQVSPTENCINLDITPEKPSDKRDSFNELVDLCCMNMNAVTAQTRAKNRDSFLDIDMGAPSFVSQSAATDSSRHSIDCPRRSLEAAGTDSSSRYSELRLRRSSKGGRPSLPPSLSPLMQAECEDDQELEKVDIETTSFVTDRKRSNHKRKAMLPDEIVKIQLSNLVVRAERGHVTGTSIDSDVAAKNVLQTSTSANRPPKAMNCVSFANTVTTPVKIPLVTIESDKENQKDVEAFSKFLNHEKHVASTPNAADTKPDKQVAILAMHPVAMQNDHSCDNCAIKIEQLEEKIDSKFGQLNAVIAASEERWTERFDEIKSLVNSMHMSLQFNMWCLRDTDIADIRDGVLSMVQRGKDGTPK